MTTERKRMRQLSATSSEWASANPTLLDGEIGYDTTLRDFKVGPGEWNALPYHFSNFVKLLGGNGQIIEPTLILDNSIANTLTGIQLRARPTDNIQEISFRVADGSLTDRWDIRLQHNAGNPLLTFRPNGITTASFFASGFASFTGAMQANGVVSLSGEIQGRTDANPSFSMRNAAGQIGALLYLNRAGESPTFAGRISFNSYAPDGTLARIVGQIEDRISDGGVLASAQSIITREHGDARYGQRFEAVGNSQTVFQGDIDTLFGPNASSVYFCNTVATNAPENVNGNLFVETHPTNGNFAAQRFVENGGASRVWVRTRSNGVWGPWRLSGGSITTGPNFPADAVPGALHYMTAEPIGLYVLFDDGNTTQWVQTNGGGVGLTQDAADVRYLQLTGGRLQRPGQQTFLTLRPGGEDDATAFSIVRWERGNGSRAMDMGWRGDSAAPDTAFISVQNPAGSTVQTWRFPQGGGAADSLGVLRVTDGDGRYQLASSDATLKERITELDEAMPLLAALQPRNFFWKEQAQPIDAGDDWEPDPSRPADIEQVGLIAQEVQKVLPTAVLGEEGKMTVQTLPLVSLLVKAVQELAARVKELEAR